jgi:BirA family transcriptional regulator, biotin operon repressor / biotin---[acetyl-CoA-carboxylase] ligase
MYLKDKLQGGLNTHTFGRKLFVFDSLDSTNACAKTLAGTGAEEGTVVISEYQTAGRGRLGRSWESESGSNLLFSFIVRPSFDKSKVGLLPFFAATGIALAVETATGVPCECKWPNDVLMNGKKCCGILIESAFQNEMVDYVIMGVGLNVNQTSYGEDLDIKATSLKKECNKDFDRRDVFQQIMASLEFLYPDVKAGDFGKVLKEWKVRATMIGKEITLTQASEEIHGRVVALADDGGLLLSTPDGEHTYYAGDVTVIQPL